MSAPDAGRGRGPARWDRLARAAAARRGGEETRERLLELLAFVLDGDRYALPVERVREIVRLRPVTGVPRAPAEVRGVISLRGQVVQVVDLRRRLGLPAGTPTRSSRIVVLHGDDGQVAGLLVDGVTEVLRVPAESVQPPAGSDAEFVSGLCERSGGFVSIVNLERVLDLAAD